MFICSKNSRWGATDSKKIINYLANDGIRAFCLIDEQGIEISSFLNTCVRRKVNASVAIPFTSFVEGNEKVQSGYLVAATYEGYKKAKEKTEKLKNDYIALLLREDIHHLAEFGVYCLIQKGKHCIEYNVNANVKVMPVAYETNYLKYKNEGSIHQNEVLSLEENYFVPESIVFVEGVSKCPKEFLLQYEQSFNCFNLDTYRQSKALVGR